MKRLLLPFLVATLPSALLVLSPAAGAGEEVSLGTLTRHVKTLASKEFAGRRGDGARKAEAYIKQAFEAAGLKTSVRQHPFRREVARNVVGVLQAGREPSREHVLLTAHYDHLGRRGGVVFPGASDNAAGVAALLEMARLLKPPLERDVIFIAFDQEEYGFGGSTGYARRPLRPLEECAAFVTMDILGVNLADATKGLLFCVGSEWSDALFTATKKVTPPGGLDLVYAGADIVGARSDFVPFQVRRVPFLFFSAGESAHYHRPTDTPDRIDYGKLRRETRLVLDIARAVIAGPRAKFLEEPVCRVEEAATLEKVVAQLLANEKKLKFSGAELFMGRAFHQSLQDIRKSGKMTKPQRHQLVQTCRLLVRMLQGKR